MAIPSQTLGIDELLDQAGDAVARNDWALAKKLAEHALRQAHHHPEAELVLRTANAYLETDRAPRDPLSRSRDLRFMSMMFCDIVGSTQLAHRLEDALWRDTLERFRRRCARAVRRYDGYIHEAIGDELLILFGYPRIREDDARRAVLAGLDIVAAITSFSALLEEEHGVAFRVRVGIHTGRALIRERSRIGSVSRDDAELCGGLVGEAAHIAKRIETAARPNTVWVSNATRRIVEGFFEFAESPTGATKLDLDARPDVAAYQVIGRTAALNRAQIARAGSDEIVGRRAERDLLLKLWEQAQGDGAPFVVVAGHAGIGKSRLVEFLAETAAGNNANRLECICTEMLKPVAFAPLIGVLERFANIRQGDSAETRLSKLDSAFRELSPEFVGFVPYLAWMMSIPRPGGVEIEELGPEVVRDRTFDILLEVLTLAASLRPSVFWIDDVQWADHSTQEFCGRLQAACPIPGLLVVATVRTETADSDARLAWSDDRRVGGSVVRIELNALSSDESRQLIAARAGSPPDAALADVIFQSTGGNPLYIEEVVRSVVAGGDARRRGVGTARASIAVPESLQPIFAQIVERLGSDRHVAQMASLLGRELPEPLTRAVIASILGLSEDEVVGSLARLIDAEIVEPLLTELTPGYRFRHDLIREALVHSVGADATENHGRIASVIEQSFREYAQERPALLAYHFARAEQHDRAAAYWLAAGVDQQARAAHKEAIASFDEGLDSLARISEPSDATAHARQELSLRASRGVSVQTTRGYTDEKAGGDWARAYELSRQIRAEGALVPALGGLWSFHFVKGANTFVRDLGTTSVKVAEQIIEAAGDDPEAQLIGYVCLGYSQYFQGDLTAGRESAERSWELHEKVKDRPPHIHLPQDPALAALSLLGPVRWSLGDQVAGSHAAEEAVTRAAALESKRAINLARVGQTSAWLHQIRRDHQKALSSADHALAVAREFHVDWAVVNLMIHRGLALAHLNARGHGWHEAVAIVNENLAYWRAGGAETMVPYFLGELAEAHHLAGDESAALELVEAAIALGAAIGEHFHDAELYRVRGEAKLASAHDPASGFADLHTAVAKAREQHAVSFEIRAIVSLLTAAPGLPDREPWILHLENAIHRLKSSEAGKDEREARALIAREL
jgi:class 3 adenylate cyclase